MKDLESTEHPPLAEAFEDWPYPPPPLTNGLQSKAKILMNTGIMDMIRSRKDWGLGQYQQPRCPRMIALTQAFQAQDSHEVGQLSRPTHDWLAIRQGSYVYSTSRIPKFPTPPCSQNHIAGT